MKHMNLHSHLPIDINVYLSTICVTKFIIMFMANIHTYICVLINIINSKIIILANDNVQKILDLVYPLIIHSALFFIVIRFLYFPLILF